MMEVTNLSSNWKKLQASIQKKPSNPSTVLGKRKTRAEESKPPTALVRHRDVQKRSEATRDHQKSRDKPQAKSRHMGLLASKPTSDADEAPKLPHSGAIEDIPASQLSLSRKPSSASLRSFKDSINSGVVPSVAVGKYVAIDCEMVGVGPDPSRSSMLARVSMVNYHGEQIYDTFVAPKETVTDYRTFVSGITEELLREARSFAQVQEDVAALLEGRILVGHAVRHDLDVLMLGHPKRDIRDTSRHKPYREIANGRTPGLKRLAKDLLGIDIQAGAHSSIEDARATMMLYKREKNAFEREHVRKFGVDRRQTRPQTIDGENPAVNDRAQASKSKPGKKKKRKR